MKKDNIILTTGILTAISCTVFIVHSHKRKQKNEIGQQLLRQVTIMLYPAAKRLFIEEALDPQYHERAIKSSNHSVEILPGKKAKGFADQLFDSWGGWISSDDTNKIYAILAQIRDKVQMSQVAAAYAGIDIVNLRDDFSQRLSTAEIEKVLDIISPLPLKTTR